METGQQDGRRNDEAFGPWWDLLFILALFPPFQLRPLSKVEIAGVPSGGRGGEERNAGARAEPRRRFVSSLTGARLKSLPNQGQPRPPAQTPPKLTILSWRFGALRVWAQRHMRDGGRHVRGSLRGLLEA